MAKEWAKRFYGSDQWQTCRSGYIAERIRIDGGMCQVCGVNLGYIVHHKIILTPENISNPDVSLNWENLSYECKDCHDKHEGHGVKRHVFTVCSFDSDGNPTGIYPKYERSRL